MKPRSLAARLALALVLAALASVPRVAAAAGAPVTVVVDGASPAMTQEVRAAIERELAGVSVAEGARPARLFVRFAADTAEVVFEHPDGRILTRTIALPKGKGEASEAVGLLAGNLVRDQTADLEAELRAKRPAPPAAAPPAAEPAADAQPKTVGTGAPDVCRVSGPSYPALELVPDMVLPTAAADPATTRVASLSLVGGHKGRTRGASVALLGDFGSGGTCGLHLAGLFAWGEGHVHGAQLSGVVANATSIRGAQVSGVLARATGRVEGFQSAAVVVASDLTGGQLGAVSIARDLEGLQAGALSIARDGSGFQLGALSLARDLHGLQAGAVSIARNVRGLQLGAVNVATRSEGVQLGVVNVADDAEAPLGLVNVIRNGRLHVDGFALDYPGFAAALVHGGRYTHAIQGIGVRRDADGVARPVFLVGMGGHVRLGDSAFTDVDVLYHALPQTSFQNIAYVAQLRVIAGIMVMRGVSVFVGPTLSLAQMPVDSDEKLGIFGSRKLDWGGNAIWRTWPGATFGARFLLAGVPTPTGRVGVAPRRRRRERIAGLVGPESTLASRCWFASFARKGMRSARTEKTDLPGMPGSVTVPVARRRFISRPAAGPVDRAGLEAWVGEGPPGGASAPPSDPAVASVAQTADEDAPRSEAPRAHEWVWRRTDRSSADAMDEYECRRCSAKIRVHTTIPLSAVSSGPCRAQR